MFYQTNCKKFYVHNLFVEEFKTFLNITHEEEEALKELKKDKNIVILKADKGNATIIMNATEYNDKINCLLSDSSVYSKLSKKSNSITKITSDVNKYV